jgi:hypothetical protein
MFPLSNLMISEWWLPGPESPARCHLVDRLGHFLSLAVVTMAT